MKKRIVGLILLGLTGSLLAKEKIYLKGGIGGGFGLSKKASLLMWTEGGEEVRVSLEGAFNVEGGFGYSASPKSNVEFSIGYRKAEEDPPLTNGNGYFKRIALTTTYLYQLKTRFISKTLIKPYIGGGIGIYRNGELYRKGPGIETKLSYKPSFGYHGVIGGRWGKEGKYLLFGDVRYITGIKYRLEKAIENGKEYSPEETLPQFQELKSKGLLLNIGIIYLLE